MKTEVPGTAIPPSTSRHLIVATESDRFFDYCLQPYEPRSSPAGKLRAENLLWRSLEIEQLSEALGPAIDAIRRCCGRDMTVFGVKCIGGKLFWELYFYDPQKEDVRVTAASVAQALAPAIRIAPLPDETIPYFMFSIDLDGRIAASRRIDTMNLYLSAHRTQAGRSYKFSTSGMEFDNIYQFLHPKKDIEEILHGLRSSVFVDFQRTPISGVIFPELFTCRRVCVAKKRRADGIYFSGIEIDQLLWFLRRFQYPSPLVEFAEQHRTEFTHLLFDVGLDYTSGADGQLIIGKTSFYGTL